MSNVGLGTKVKFVDGERGRVVGLRRASVDGVVRDQCLVGPDQDGAFLDDEGTIDVWVDVESVSVLTPLSAPDPVYDLQSKLADARLALLSEQVNDRVAMVDADADPLDVALRAILDLLPLLRVLPLPAAVTGPLETAAHRVITAITGDTP